MTPQKPAPKRPPGKPSLNGGGESPVLCLRMPADLKARCQRNGLQWVRGVLAAAPDGPPSAGFFALEK